MSSYIGNNLKINTDDKSKPKDENSLPSKMFIRRNSLLTDLFENTHIQMMYNISTVVFLGVTWNTFLEQYLKDGTFNLGQKLIYAAFGKFNIVIFIWIITFFLSLLCYPLFHLWAKTRVNLMPGSLQMKVWDRLCIYLTLFYYFGAIMFVPAKLLWDAHLPMMSSVVVLCESIRFLMKCHAFIRVNAENVLNYKPHTDKRIPIPPFSKFIYFSFAPTLVYQDEYPRTAKIRGSYVVKRLIDFFIALMFSSVIMNTFVDKLENVCVEQKPWTDLMLIIFQQALMGLLMTLIFFYLLLHAWMNAFAELLRFGDRLFYKDWWTSMSYQRFYRTWNNVVHDWLYTYILKDCYEILMPKNKAMSRITVLLVSAVFHEYILMLTLRIFFPVFFIFYVIPSMLFWAFKEPKHWTSNLGVLYSQGLGISVFLVMYGVEYLARQNCPPEEDTWTNVIIPRFWRCQCFV